jgi:hypothetical protein
MGRSEKTIHTFELNVRVDGATLASALGDGKGGPAGRSAMGAYLAATLLDALHAAPIPGQCGTVLTHRSASDRDTFSAPLTLHRDEEPKRVRDVLFGDLVRPAFAHRAYRALDVVVLGEGYVKVLWSCDPADGGAPPMGTSTVFEAEEWVAIQ